MDGLGLAPTNPSPRGHTKRIQLLKQKQEGNSDIIQATKTVET